MRAAPFYQYFFSYILRAKTRQRLLFIAVSGLFISAFSLMVIQGIMGGLQKGLISRSKAINGSHILKLDVPNDLVLKEIKEILIKENIPFYSEIEVEVMLKHKAFAAPAKLHGIDLSDPLPEFLIEKDFKGLVMGSDLASKIRLQFLDDVQIISPGVTDSLMGEVPRFLSEGLSDYMYTELSEVDEFEVWVRGSFVQNLLRQRGLNQIRIFGNVPASLKASIMQKASMRWTTWEEMNNALVWSLNLETNVMLFLFMSMSLLVAIAITSGLLIFYSKIRRDLMSFWILGMAQSQLVKLCFRFTLYLSAATCLVGGTAGYVFLKIVELYGHEIVPDIFVERRLPVDLSLFHVLVSLLIPFGISVIFSYFSFSQFRKENQSFVAIVRSLG